MSSSGLAFPHGHALHAPGQPIGPVVLFAAVASDALKRSELLPLAMHTSQKQLQEAKELGLVAPSLLQDSPKEARHLVETEGLLNSQLGPKSTPCLKK